MDCYTYLLSQYGSRLKEHSIEVPITAQQNRFFLPDDTLLLNKTVVGMYFWTGADDSPETGRPAADKNTQENSFLTFKANNIEILSSSPLAAYGLSDTDRSIKPIMMESFTPSKSFISVGDPTILTAGQSYYLTFIYLD